MSQQRPVKGFQVLSLRLTVCFTAGIASRKRSLCSVRWLEKGSPKRPYLFRICHFGSLLGPGETGLPRSGFCDLTESHIWFAFEPWILFNQGATRCLFCSFEHEWDEGSMESHPRGELRHNHSWEAGCFWGNLTGMRRDQIYQWHLQVAQLGSWGGESAPTADIGGEWWTDRIPVVVWCLVCWFFPWPSE